MDYDFRQRASLFLSVLALLLLAMLGSTVCYAQAINGSIVGTVVDSSGAAVTNAEVSATNVATSFTTTAKTNTTGGYRFDNLPVGTYRVAVKAPGFRTTVQQVEV